MNHTAPHFDREVPLLEALGILPRKRLERVLSRLLGSQWYISGAHGEYALGPGINDRDKFIAIPLKLEIEVIGQLHALNSCSLQAETAAQWLELVLMMCSRFRMVSELHIQSVEADFQALQQKHAALEESEARYRELTLQLDQRVQSQIAEIELRQRQIYQSEKMASVGSLAAGMAHEINTPIGFICSNLTTATSYIQTLADFLSTSQKINSGEAPMNDGDADLDFILSDFPVLISECVAGANRIANIVAHLKKFAITEGTYDRNVDMNEVIQAAAAVICDQLPDTISMELDLQAVPCMACDRSRMIQVFFSIIQNARQAIEEKQGTIRVTSKVIGQEIHVQVSDNGCGIKPECLHRIFDPFFTTRDVGQGTGLGLTVSRDIITGHAGRINVQSEWGVGSIFTVCLPCMYEANSRETVS